MSTLPPWLAPHATKPLGALIDHTLLRPESLESDILRLCDEARSLGLGAVCVNGQWVSAAVRRLDGQARVVAVAGFPLGASGAGQKAFETEVAVRNGAGEVDVVQSLGWALAARRAELERELALVVQAAGGRPVKVILETAALSREQIVESCRAAVAAGAAAVKTSTGFHPAGGATAEAVTVMRETVGPGIGVKASGGIRTQDDAIRMLLAGADRIGTSSAASWSEVGRIVRDVVR